MSADANCCTERDRIEIRELDWPSYPFAPPAITGDAHERQHHAVTAPLTRGFDLAVARDVIKQGVGAIKFSPTRAAQFVCRVPRT